jgi:hypothetical protein
MHLSFNKFFDFLMLYSLSYAVFDHYLEKHYLFIFFNKNYINQNYKYTIQDNTSNNVDDTIISSLNYDVGGG